MPPTICLRYKMIRDGGGGGGRLGARRRCAGRKHVGGIFSEISARLASLTLGFLSAAARGSHESERWLQKTSEVSPVQRGVANVYRVLHLVRGVI